MSGMRLSESEVRAVVALLLDDGPSEEDRDYGIQNCPSCRVRSMPWLTPEHKDDCPMPRLQRRCADALNRPSRAKEKP